MMIKLNQNLRFLFSSNPVTDAKSYFLELNKLTLKVDQRYRQLTKMDEILYWRADIAKHFTGFSVIGFEELEEDSFYVDTTNGELSDFCDESSTSNELFITKYSSLVKIDVMNSSQERLSYSQFMRIDKESD